MRIIIAIGLGGACGSVLRYLVAGWTQQLSNTTTFPVGTLAVNVIGCLVIGILAGLSENAGVFGPSARAFLLIGLLGGFTTFSTFAYETTALTRDAQFFSAFLNIALQVTTGLFAAWLGYKLHLLIK
ncbi:fluoride efflux transporter CrcB [bacterium]|nr:fluoride efflux transporter CrcB [bacterium]